MKNKTKYHTVGTIPKSNIKIVERGKIDTFNTQIHVPDRKTKRRFDVQKAQLYQRERSCNVFTLINESPKDHTSKTT